MAVRLAIDSCVSRVYLRRLRPTYLVRATKKGTRTSAAMDSSQEMMSIATTDDMTVAELETIAAIVSVTTDWVAAMSFARRDCTSPVRVDVKNWSGCFWRWA